MTAAHVHLMLNHIPILGFAFGLLLLAWGRWRGSDEVVRAAFALFAVVGVTAFLVSFSGERAEDVVEGLAGVSHDAIEAHEEMGQLAMIVSVVVGLASAVALWAFRKGAVPRWAQNLAMAAALVAFGFLGYAAYQGGQVHHQELRPGGAAEPAGEAVEASAAADAADEGDAVRAALGGARGASPGVGAWKASPTGAPLRFV